MNDREILHPPSALAAILEANASAGFTMASEPTTGSLLRTLAASKRGGRLLELGTGTGVGTCWLLSGMDDAATLDTVESDGNVQAIARQHLGHDPRLRFHHDDGAAFIDRCAPR